MALPVTGPHYRLTMFKAPYANPAGFRPDWGFREQWSYRQAKPFDRPLDYDMLTVQVLTYEHSVLNDLQIPTYLDVLEQPSGSAVTAAYNKAYERYRNAVTQTASLAVSLAERKQAASMMTKRIEQLLTFGNCIRHRRFTQACDVLGISRNSLRRMNIRKGAKAASSNYLEFHFGWSPLVSDIGSAIDVLQSPIRDLTAVGTATVRGKTLWVNPEPWWHTTHRTWLARVRIASDVRVTNPNLWRANQLGFVNPATVLWELVPFSFVLDWFVNVSDFLSGFSDNVGLSLANSYVTTVKEGRTVFRQYDNYGYSGIHRRVTRGTGTPPGPILSLRAPWNLSVRRGAAAAALLVQLCKTIR